MISSRKPLGYIPNVAVTVTHNSDALSEATRSDKTIVTDYIHPHSLNNGIPTVNILPPKVGGEFEVDDAVLEGCLYLASCVVVDDYI